MAVVRVDMAAKSERRAVPDGNYVAELIQIVEGVSSLKQSPQLNVTMEIIEPEALAGLTLLDFLPKTDLSMFRRADFFFACGIEDGVVFDDS